jgi:hypothetical protein
MPDEDALVSPAPTPTDSPEPAATLEPASLQTQEQTGDEPAQVEGGEDGAEKPEPPAWATVTSAEDLFEHESVKPLHEERLTAARETAKKEGASETHKRLQPLMDRQQDTLRGINDKVEQFTSQWNRLARAKDEDGKPTVDPARLQDLLDDNREAFAALGGMHRNEGIWSGAAGLVKELADAMKSDSFTSDFRPRLERMQRGDTDSSVFTDMVDAIADSAKEPLKAELKEKDAKITRLEKEVRDAQRNGQAPPANPPGGAGGGGKSRAEEDEILMNPETHIDVIREITARRKARA